jgi:flagellar motor switch protein FliG
MMNLCIPYLTIHELMPRLSQRLYYSVVRTQPAAPPVEVAGLAVGVELYYEGERLSLGDLTRLKRGSLVRVPGHGTGDAFLRAGGVPLHRLHARRARGRPTTYVLAEREGASFVSTGERRKTSQTEDKPDALRLALQTLSAEVTGALRSVTGGLAALERRQEELQDQLIFQSPDKEVVSGGEQTGQRTPRPFDFIRRADPAILVGFLRGEHPQLVALVLSYLEPALSALVLPGISEELQADVVKRIAAMGKVAPETLRTVERILEEQMRVALSTEYAAAGGLDAVVQILGVADRALERLVVGSLEKQDPELAEEIKKHMVVFEDIALLDRQDTGKVLREVTEEDLLWALKAVEDSVRTHVLESMAPGAAETFLARLQQTGAVRLRDADAAQQRIVATMRTMEEQGRIVLARRQGP